MEDVWQDQTRRLVNDAMDIDKEDLVLSSIRSFHLHNSMYFSSGLLGDS